MKKLAILVATFLVIPGLFAQALAQEWSHSDWADLRPLDITFDKIELFIWNSGVQTFVCPVFEDPHAPDSSPMAWDGGMINSNFVLATGTATQAVGWTDYFSGPQSEAFTLTLLAYSGGTFVFGGDCEWDGSSYSCPTYWTDAGDSRTTRPEYDRTEAWSYQNWANLVPLGLSFDKMELFIIAGDQTYVDPGVDNFLNENNMPHGWSGLLCHDTHARAEGPATQYVRWFDYMSGPRPETYTMTALFWLDGAFVLGQDAVWHGCDGWTQSDWWTDLGDDPHPSIYDRSCTVATEESTWGRIKELYR